MSAKRRNGRMVCWLIPGDLRNWPRCWPGSIVCLALGLVPSFLPAATVVLKNRMQFEGALGYISSVVENPLAKNVADEVRQIVVLNDGLRRTFVSSNQIEELRESDPTRGETIRIPQKVASGGRHRVASISSVLRVGEFDAFGRRTYSIMTPRGAVDITQGITEITPLYTKLEGLVGTPSIQWDSRIATSSLPRETISQLLRTQVAANGPEGRLQVVRLFFEAERFNDARIELEQAMQEYPELASFQELLEQLRQYSARRVLDELELRKRAGQHQRVQTLLAAFPQEGVAGETLLRLRDLMRDYETATSRIQSIHQDLEQFMSDPVTSNWKAELEKFQNELKQRLNFNSLDRLADYERLKSDPKATVESRLAMLVSGWVLGAGNSVSNLMEAASAYRTRDLVVAYLRSASDQERQSALEALGQEEGATVDRVVQALRLVDPPVATEAQADRPPGNFRIQVPGLRPSDAPFVYEIQLPEEYDPQRTYPVIVSLHGAGHSPTDQIDWWAGAYDAARQTRMGQATRHGYIVMAPAWMNEVQSQYTYTGREHAAVLSCLRDAQRRFAIDTDRVFVSGHSTGGDAAWDIGLAHPDLWAGVLPVAALADYGPNAPKYVSQYWQNGRYVPFYFVGGELDGLKMEQNGRDLDRYLTRRDFDVTVIEFLGRGHEPFADEILRQFQWMELHRRNPLVREFECVSLRTFDNFFWYLELSGLPPRSLVEPLAWPAPSGTRPSVHEFRITANQEISLKTGATNARFWLPPGLLEPGQRLVISVNGKQKTFTDSPDMKTLLEDARTRSDRLHPFWMVVDLVTGKR